MTQPASQPAQRVDLRQQMPGVARFVEEKRKEFGKAHVDDCLRRALKGEPGFFYAVERGHVLGTPWPKGHELCNWVTCTVAASASLGAQFVAFIAEPVRAGGEHGAN